MKITSSFLLVFAGFLCLTCQETKPKVNQANLTHQFYHAMSASDLEALASLYKDSVRVGEGPYLNVIAFPDYQDWLQWDSVFHPQYDILELEESDSIVWVKIAKTCERILFLNGKPLITREALTFQEGKVHSLVIQEYIDYDQEAWVARREKLVAWVAKNHPELDGFIHDQTRQGALNYLKAIELYQAPDE